MLVGISWLWKRHGNTLFALTIRYPALHGKPVFERTCGAGGEPNLASGMMLFGFKATACYCVFGLCFMSCIS